MGSSPAGSFQKKKESFESFSGVGILEVASLSLDEPEMEAISFEEHVEDVNAEEGEDIADWSLSSEEEVILLLSFN